MKYFNFYKEKHSLTTVEVVKLRLPKINIIIKANVRIKSSKSRTRDHHSTKRVETVLRENPARNP